MNNENQDLSNLADLQGVAERTREVTIIERVVAKDNDKYKEVEVETTVFVRPMPFRKWLGALQYATNILASFPEAENLDLANPTLFAVWIAKLLGSCPDDVIGIVCLATDRKPEFFDRIDLDEGIKLATAVVEVNKDFFVQKVLPLISEAVPQLKKNIAVLGQTA